jgi:hypothetical protein
MASQIIPGDYDSWYNEFTWMADQIQALAAQAKTPTSKRESLFRASSYYRLAPFFLTDNASDSRLYTNWQLAIDDFNEAISLMDTPGVPFTVPGPNYDVLGYFFKTSKAGCEKAPTIIVGDGYDGAQQDAWHALGQDALDRGYNFVTYEGPGQPSVIRDQKVGFVPDWWNVVTPVVDWLAKRDDVDMDNLALAGISFGGILAPLAATHEHRLKAVISIDGALNLAGPVLADFNLTQVFASGNATLFNGYIAEILSSPELPTSGRWILGQSNWVMNTTDHFDAFTQLNNINLDQAKVDNITAQGWVGRGQGDDSFPGQEIMLASYYNASGKSDSHYQFFRTDMGAGLHCQLGAEQQLAQSIYDWLNGIFLK